MKTCRHTQKEKAMKIIALNATRLPNFGTIGTMLAKERITDIARTMAELCEQVSSIDTKWGKDIDQSVPPSLFTDAEFLKATEKKEVLHDWEKFIKNGFSFSTFTSAIYTHLSVRCGFIAHYNRVGFYQTYWREDIAEYAREHNLTVRPVPSSFYNWVLFLAQFRIYGDYRDINTAMMKALRSHLIAFIKELENEAIGHFKAEVNFKTDLAGERRLQLKRLEAELEIRLEALRRDMIQLDPETFIAERLNYYRQMFPSMDDQSFSMKGLAGSLF